MDAEGFINSSLFHFPINPALANEGRSAALHPLCTLKAGKEKTINDFILKSNFLALAYQICPEVIHSIIYNPVYLIVDYDNRVDESNEDSNRKATYNLVWENHCTDLNKTIQDILDQMP